MHEFGIVSALYKQAVQLAMENDISVVNQVDIEIGEQRQIVPEVLETAWSSVIKDTMLGNATLKYTIIPMLAKCNICKREYHPDVFDYRCPACNVAKAKLLQGDDIILTSITGDKKEE